MQGLLVAGSNQRSANLAGPFGCKSYMKEMFSAEVDDQQKIRLSARLRPRKPNIRDNAFPVNFHVVCGCKKMEGAQRLEDHKKKRGHRQFLKVTLKSAIWE